MTDTLTASPTVERRGVLASLGQAPWALLDQMLISATNFVTTILLARRFSQGDFGSFNLVYSVLLFVNTIQAGLITQPHNILGATRRGEDYARYTTSTGVGQLVLAIAAAALALIAWMVFALAGWATAPLVLALAPAIVAWQLQEFARRVLYTEGRLSEAFATDLIGYGGQAIIVAMLWRMHRLTGPIALHALAATMALAAVVGCWCIRRSICRTIDRSILVENWHFGKWVAGGDVVGQWLSVQMFAYIAAGILGSFAAGILRAIHTVFGPSRIIAEAFYNLLPIRFARTLADGGKRAMHTQMMAAYLLAIPLLGGYCLLVAVFAKPILYVFYAKQYAGCASVLGLYAVAAFISYMTMVVAAGLRAKRLTRHVFIGQLGATLISLPIGWALIHKFGIHGTVLGMATTYVAMTALFWRAYSRDHGKQTTTAAVPHRDQQPMPAEGQPSTEGTMLLRVLRALDESGVEYCILHGYRDYPRVISSDVDIIVRGKGEVSRGGVTPPLQAQRDAIGVEIVQCVHEDTRYYVLAGKAENGSVSLLRLDVSSDCELADRRLYSGGEILAGRRRFGEFWVPAAEVEFASYVARRCVKGVLSEEHARVLSELYASNPEGCRKQLKRFWKAAECELIEAAARSGDWEPLRRALPHLRRKLLWRLGLRHPLIWAGRWTMRNIRRIGRWLRPKHGLHIVLLGPDGAGKSSVARAIRSDLAPAFFSSTWRTFPPGLLNRAQGNETAPHAIRPRSYLSSIIRAVAYWFVYHSAGYLVTIWPELARCTLVVNDRHLVDCLVDPKRYRYSGPAWLMRLIWRLIPKPDLVIALDAPAELLQARKQEVPIEETARQREEYRQLAMALKNGRIVDASQPLDRVIADAEWLIVRHMADRAARQLGLGRLARPNPTVSRVMRELTGQSGDKQWVIEGLGHGDQGDAYLVRSADAAPLWGSHRRLVVKLYRNDLPEHELALEDEYESLSRLRTALDGATIEGWQVRSPMPLYHSAELGAIVMTAVPGLSLNAILAADGDHSSETIDVLARGVVAAMERYWSTQGRIYGDLDFNNILADLGNRGLSFIDPGVPEEAFVCPDASRNWFPASRDLAYLLFDAAASIRPHIMTPGVRKRRRQLVESVFRAYLSRIDSHRDAQSLLDEVRQCTRVHLGRISVSWSPVGLSHLIVRHMAARCIDAMIQRLANEHAGSDEEAAAGVSEKRSRYGLGDTKPDAL